MSESENLFTIFSSENLNNASDKFFFQLEVKAFSKKNSNKESKLKHIKFYNKSLMVMKVLLLSIQSASEKTAKYLTLDFDVIVSFTEEAPSGEKINGFLLEKGSAKASYYIVEKENFQKVKKFFKGRINQRGFHESFKALKKLGKGNFAHVWNFVHFRSI